MISGRRRWRRLVLGGFLADRVGAADPDPDVLLAELADLQAWQAWLSWLGNQPAAGVGSAGS